WLEVAIKWRYIVVKWLVIRFVLMTIAWFTMNKENNASGMGVKTAANSFDIAVSGNQIMHNKFTYEIYIATPVTSSAYNALSSSEKNACIAYETHPGKNTENTSLEITNDLIPDNEGYVYFSYGSKLEGDAVIEDEAQDINGKYVNNKDNTFKLAKSKTDNDYYYTQTYGTYANVQSLSVPLYWQAHDLPTSLGSDAVSNKQDFCRYFILKVTWDRNEQARQETKESDMVYLSIERSS
nr:hypothetical protein [Eubacterium sp.]